MDHYYNDDDEQLGFRSTLKISTIIECMVCQGLGFKLAHAAAKVLKCIF